MLKFIGVAAGPVLYAVVRDVTGSYRGPLIASCVTTLACTVFSVKMHLPEDHMPFVPEVPMVVKPVGRRAPAPLCSKRAEAEERTVSLPVVSVCLLYYLSPLMMPTCGLRPFGLFRLRPMSFLKFGCTPAKSINCSKGTGQAVGNGQSAAAAVGEQGLGGTQGSCGRLVVDIGVGDDRISPSPRPSAVDTGVGDDKALPSPRPAVAFTDEGVGDDDIGAGTSPFSAGAPAAAADGPAGDEEDPDAPFLPSGFHERHSGSGRLLRRKKKKRPARLARVSYHLDRMHHS